MIASRTIEQADDEARRVPLSQLPRGSFAKVACTSRLCAEDAAFLKALGISAQTCLRICGTRGACVLEVGGPEEMQRHRVAVSSCIAKRILVNNLEPVVG